MPDIAWTVLAWVIGLAGLGCMVWGRVREIRARRPDGPRRCPRCWHDLSATPGLRCTECGRAATRERHLRRPRWRRGPAAAGLALLAVVPFAVRVPAARKDGWPAIVPASVLVVVFPLADRLSSQDDWGWGPQGLLVPPSRTAEIASTLADELLRRASAEHDALHGVHWRVLSEHSIRARKARGNAPPADPPTRPEWLLDMAFEQGRLATGALARVDRMSRLELDVPTTLPADVPVAAIIRVIHWRNVPVAYRIRDRRTGALVHVGVQDEAMGMIRPIFVPWADDRSPIGRTADSDTTLALTIELDEMMPLDDPLRPWIVYRVDERPRRIRTYDVDIPVRVSATIGETFEFRSDDEVGAALLAGIGPRFHRRWLDEALLVAVDGSAARMAARDVGIDTIAVRVELRDEEVVVASTVAWWVAAARGEAAGDLSPFIGESTGEALALEWIDSSAPPRPGTLADDRRLRLHIIGDPVVASRRAAASVIWDGEVSMPWPPPAARSR